MILNDSALVVNESPDVVQELYQVLDRILKTYYISNGSPEYDKIRLSEEYNKLQEFARFLQIFEPGNFREENEKKTFWINLYNLLTLHGILHFQIKLTVWERPNFFFSTEYNIGGYRFSLFDILQGVLRRNGRRWRFLPPPFRGHDPRSRFMCNEFDPRIHFALHSGSRSCPQFAVYSPASIDDELDAAARRFLNSNQFVYDKQTRILNCSKIIKWYAQDFGKNKADRLAYLSQFIEDAEIRDILKDDAASISVKYMQYDWHLNSSE